MSHRPPKNDRERLENLIEALAEPGDGDDAIDERMRADSARRGLTLETWAAQMEARAHAVLDDDRRARRKRALTIAAAVVAALAAAGGGALALQALGRQKGGVEVEQTFKPLSPMTQPDAGQGGPTRK